MATKRNPWDRFTEKGESFAAHELFLVFLSFGDTRTLAQVTEKTGRTLKLVQALSAKFHWVRRAKAYDLHLRKISEQAIENRSKQEALIWADRDLEHRNNTWSLADRLKAKLEEMLEFPLYEVIVKEMQRVVVDGQPITDANGTPVLIETTIHHKPFKWTAKDIGMFAKVQDELHRMALGVPTSRTAVEVSPAMTLEERLTKARSAMKFYIDNKLERAVQRIWEKDRTQDISQIRQDILEELPIWTAEDHKIPDPLMLTEYIPPEPLSLDDLEPNITSNLIS